MKPKNRSALTHRIARGQHNQQLHAAQQLAPAIPSATGTAIPHPDMPVMTMPLTLVEMTASGQQVSSALPLYAGPGGAPVPATAPGQWQQIYAAGRP